MTADEVKEEHKYCSVCGYKMVTQKYTLSYDTRTGTPKNFVMLECRNWAEDAFPHDRYKLSGGTVGQHISPDEVFAGKRV